MKVAFQGEHGAYSELAAVHHFSESIESTPCKTFSEVFKIVEKGETQYGLIPIENSLEGSIGQNYDLLLKTNLKFLFSGIQPIKSRWVLTSRHHLRKPLLFYRLSIKPTKIYDYKKDLFRFLKEEVLGGEKNVIRFKAGNQKPDRVHKKAAAQDGDKGWN